MGWRDHLEPWEVRDLQALERQLKQAYCEHLEHQRRTIISRGHQRATIANRKAKQHDN